MATLEVHDSTNFLSNAVRLAMPYGLEPLQQGMEGELNHDAFSLYRP